MGAVFHYLLTGVFIWVCASLVFCAGVAFGALLASRRRADENAERDELPMPELKQSIPRDRKREPEDEPVNSR